MIYYHKLLLRHIERRKLKRIIKQQTTCYNIQNAWIDRFILELIYSDEINDNNMLQLYSTKIYFSSCASLKTSGKCWQNASFEIPTKYKNKIGYCDACMYGIMNTANIIINNYGWELFYNIEERYILLKRIDILDDILKLIMNNIIKLYLK